MNITYVYNVFQVFLQVLQPHVLSVSSLFPVCCKCFIWMFLSISGVAHGMRVVSGRSASGSCTACIPCVAVRDAGAGE
jgi:hypothetical protein